MGKIVFDAISAMPAGRADARVFKIGLPVFREALATAGVAAGLKKRVHPHLLRHTAASLAVQSGIALEVVGEILGHSSVAITSKYAHLRPEHLAAGVAAVDAALAC
jgi:site-specific recombinase XerD